jgi:carboxyl-terminal processing protease
VKRDDVITHVDGQSIKGVNQDDIVGKLRGPVGSQIKLTLTRKGHDGPIQVAIARAHVVPPTVVARREGSILMLHITSFNQKTSASLARELARATRDAERPVTGIVLDLRGNPGGLLDQAVEVADQFLADGRIISTIGRHPDSNQTFDASSGEAGERLPLVVLVNGRSASSAEIVAAALADRGRALVVGSTTYGKGTVQTIVRLPNSGEMTLTWSRIYTPSGRLLHEHGVAPAVCTADEEDRANALLAALKARRATPALMTDRPAKGPEACPRDGETRAADAEIARRLISDAALYTAVLNTKRPAVAAR